MLFRAIWRVSGQKKLGVHTGELAMKQTTCGKNCLLSVAAFRACGKKRVIRLCQTNLNFPHDSRKGKMLNPRLLMYWLTWKKIHFLRRHI
jgi:hypothetical protein